MKVQKFVLFLGDIGIFYASLAATLLIRYGTSEFSTHFNLHFLPFTILFFLWFLVFLMSGLYDNEIFDAGPLFQESLIRVTLANFVLGVILFYAVPAFGITPKTNLAITALLTGFLIFGWRKLMALAFAKRTSRNILFFGFSAEAAELSSFLKSHPSLGYSPSAILYPKGEPKFATDIPSFELDHKTPEIIKEKNISLVVALKDIRDEKDFVNFIYQALPEGIIFLDFPTFYERIFGKIPVSMIHEIWFLENLSETRKHIYESVKRGFDVMLGIFIGCLTLLIIPIVALAIKLDSSGPVFIYQKRVGKNKKSFNLIKFRSMFSVVNDRWTDENDKRITRVGSVLRKTRIDELPQVWNVLKGEMSFIGPRPETTEIVEILNKEIPHYQMRHLIKPGLTGWAQINFPYGASKEDAMSKLQYDLFYIKNRSFLLDFIISLKTIITIISRSGR